MSQITRDQELANAREAVRELAHVARELLREYECPGSIRTAMINKINFYASEGKETV
jgi:hypothetical protein